jgi:hypothetical protein
LVAPTGSSNNARPRRNHAARLSFLLSLLGVAAIPVAAAITESRDDLRLVHAGFAVPVAFVLSLLGLVCARRGTRNFERTLGRIGGRGLARAGRILGWIGIYLALVGAASIGVWAYLEYIASD